MAEAKSGAVLFNKRSLSLLEMPFAHSFGTQNDGWRVDVLEPGRLVARFTHGGQQQIDVQSGDSLVASGEDIYLTLKGPQPPGGGGGPQPSG